MTLPIHLDKYSGVERKLALLPPTPRCMAVREQSERLPVVVPQSKWKECDYWEPLNSEAKKKLIRNQGTDGTCAPYSGVGANAMERYYRTGEIWFASAPWIYDSRENNRQDNGMVITDVRELFQRGVPDETSYFSRPQYRTPGPVSGVTYTEIGSKVADEPAEYATGLFRFGAFPQAGICVDQIFENFTKGGIAWGGRVPRGMMNHSIYLAGVRIVEGQWCFRMINSWGSNWGPFGDGSCFIPVAAAQPGGWVHISTEDTRDKP